MPRGKTWTGSGAITVASVVVSDTTSLTQSLSGSGSIALARVAISSSTAVAHHGSISIGIGAVLVGATAAIAHIGSMTAALADAVWNGGGVKGAPPRSGSLSIMLAAVFAGSGQWVPAGGSGGKTCNSRCSVFSAFFGFEVV